MRILSHDNIIRILCGYNQWWQTRSVQRMFLKPVHRTVYGDIVKILSEDKIRRIYVIGPHRTGKTALIHQILQGLIDGGTNPRSILYMNYSHPFFNFLPILKFYETYRDYIHPGNDSRIYCFVDDMQLSPEWEKNISRLSEIYSEVTIIAFGSIYPEHIDENCALLHMPPISFYEYCQIAEGTYNLSPKSLFPTNGILKSSTEELKMISKHIAKYRPYFMQYLYTGGFLNLIGETDEIRIQRMIQKGVVGDALLRDISTCFGVRNTMELQKVFLYLCFECPGVISYEALMRAVDCVTRPTIEKYVNYLSKSGLIYMCYPDDMESDTNQKIRPKIYLTDASINTSLLMLADVRFNESNLNKIVESAIYRHLRFYGPEFEEGKITYSRDKVRGKNLDMILTGRKRMFIDVRYENDIKLSPKDAIISRSREADICLVITKNDNMIGFIPRLPDNIFCLPANIFLYLIGQAKYEGRSFVDGI